MIQFLCTSPKPKINGTDALYNEINLLQQKFNGSIKSLYPFSNPTSHYPIQLFGLHNLYKIKKAETSHRINHIFAPTILNLPFIKFLKNPIFYSVIAGIDGNNILKNKSFMDRIHTFIVSNERDMAELKKHGIKNVKLIQTAIQTTQLKKHFLPLTKKLHLLMASAPWELQQFENKGIHLILKALKNTDNIHVTFLWRNVLPAHMEKLIEQYDVGEKVNFINQKRDINQLLKKVHGCILLANDSRLVKAYPHSLIESLVCGKPIIISKQIPMSDFAEKNNCGLVLNEFSENKLIEIFTQFSANYYNLTKAVEKIDPQTFSINRMINEYENLYASILGSEK